VPVRLAIGQRDMDNGTFEVARRDTLEKETVAADEIVAKLEWLLEDIQTQLYTKALQYQQDNVTKVDSYEEFKTVLERQGGFIAAHWDGTIATEDRIKQETKATIRCIPIAVEKEEGKCMVTGEASPYRVLFAKAY